MKVQDSEETRILFWVFSQGSLKTKPKTLDIYVRGFLQKECKNKEFL